MRAFRKCWLCTVKPQYVALMKERKKTIEVRTRVPRDMRRGDGLYIMEKGTRTLALVARIEGIISFDRKELFTKVPTYQLRRTCLNLSEIDDYLKGRPRVNFIEITCEWLPTEAQRKYLTPEHFGYRCMPQGILPMPGNWKP